MSDRWQVETVWDGGEANPVQAVLRRINTIRWMSALGLGREHLWSKVLILHCFRPISTRIRSQIRGFHVYLFALPLSARQECFAVLIMAAMSVMEGISYPNVFILTGSFLLAYVFATAVYRLYFHPLAKFPGPFWAKLTTIPAWWHSRNQDRHLWLLSLQEQYGMY